MGCFGIRNKILPFSLAFLLGLVLNNLFVSTYLLKQDLRQKNVFNLNKDRSITKHKCSPADTKFGEPFKNTELNRMYDKMYKEKTEIQIWLKQNPDSSKNEKAMRQEKILIIEEQIKMLQRFDKNIEGIEENIHQKLLYVEKCYEL